MSLKVLLLLVCLTGCADGPPSTPSHGLASETASMATAPGAQRAQQQPEREPPPPPPPNSADAVTPTSLTWRWRSEGAEHRLFIRRRGDARCDVDGLACQPRGRLQDSSALFERLDMVIANAFPQMQPGFIPADIAGEFQAVAVVLANGEGRHAVLTDASTLPPGVQALVEEYKRLVEAPETFAPAP